MRTPFDIVKQYLQVSGMQKISPPLSLTSPTPSPSPKLRIVDVYRDVTLANNGFRGLFYGFHATILRDLVFSGAYFFSYEISKFCVFKATGGTKKEDKGAGVSVVGSGGGSSGEFKIPDYVKFAISGAAAGTISTIIAIPIDVVTTRLQTEITVPKENRKYGSL